jgi:hypothetical protein
LVVENKTKKLEALDGSNKRPRGNTKSSIYFKVTYPKVPHMCDWGYSLVRFEKTQGDDLRKPLEG